MDKKSIILTTLNIAKQSAMSSKTGISHSIKIMENYQNVSEFIDKVIDEYNLDIEIETRNEEILRICSKTGLAL